MSWSRRCCAGALGLLAAVCVSGGMARAATPEAISEAAPEGGGAGSITVTMDDNYPPYAFRDSAGELNGYLVDIWKLWEAKTGVRVELLASDWDKAKERMRSGEARVIDTIFKTPERERTLDFTAPYAQIPVVIYTHERIGGITRIDHLKGFLVGVKAGDACIEILEKAGVTTLQTYANYETLVSAAASGKVRIFCLDEPPANYLLYKSHAEKLFNKSFTLYTGELHRAVHKGDTQTLALLARGFSAITAREDQALRDKWMGTPTMWPTYARYLGYALLTAVLLGALLAAWGASLRQRVRQQTLRLEDERARLRALLETIPDLIWLKDTAGVYGFCNPMFERFFGAREAEIMGKTDYHFVDKELADFFRAHDQKAIDAGKPSINEEWVTFADDGHRALLETTKVPLRDANGVVVGVLGVSRDITERKNAEEQIRNLAFFDPLTQLPNRRLLLDRMQQALASSARSGREGALLFIDVDHFKTLNDTLGHDKGDVLLQEVARRIAACIREGDTVARLGGDEFVVMLEDLSAQRSDAAMQAEVVGEKILLSLRQAYDLCGQDYRCSASIGITLFDAPQSGIEDLMKRADLAMYQAKAAGRNAWRFFDPTMQAEVSARAELETDLREGLTNREFLLHYQAQVGARACVTGVTGVEVLVRWQSSRRGLVSPAAFIPLAEESGLILPLGQWVLETACRQIAAWSARPEMAHLTVAVNVSARQFGQPDFVETVLNVLDDTGASPHRLKLELTESLLLDNIEDIIQKMNRLQVVGVSFSLDDFGTGYSSLAYLKRLPLDQLKIDQSFVRDVLTDPNDAAITRTIVALAQSLGLSVIAEGVETQAQRDVLEQQGCHAYQGYLFSQPLPIEAFESFMAARA
jgi:diguanylate cyclase (GGDEF)-like protein/PAS domain S-box-containing protein